MASIRVAQTGSFPARCKQLIRDLLSLFRPVINLFPVQQQVLARARIRPVHLPIHVYVEPTTQCNLKCLHCGRTYWKGRDQHRDLDFDAFQRLTDEFARIGVASLTIQGLGEPLLHPRIFDMIRHANARGLVTRFNSNFTVMDEAMAEMLVDSGHSEVMVSFESTDPDGYADIRRRGSISDVFRNVRLLADTKKKLGASLPAICVNIVLMRSNIAQIEEMVSVVRDLGATQINFQGLNVDGIPESSRLRDGTRMRENSLSGLDVDEIDALRQRISTLDTPECPVTTNWEIGGRYAKPLPSGGIRTCRELWETPYVDSGGRVTPCCLVPDGMMMHCGNIHEKSFEEIWHGPEYNAFRRGHLTGKPHKVCEGCQAMNWIYDPATSDFVQQDSGERYAGYFLRG